MNIEEKLIDAIKKYEKMFDVDLSILLDLGLSDETMKAKLAHINQCLNDGIPDVMLLPDISATTA